MSRQSEAAERDTAFGQWAFDVASGNALVRADVYYEGPSIGVHASVVAWHHDGEWPVVGQVDFGVGFNVRRGWAKYGTTEPGYNGGALLVLEAVQEWPEYWKIQQETAIFTIKSGVKTQIKPVTRTAVQALCRASGAITMIRTHRKDVVEDIVFGHMLDRINERIATANRELDLMVA